MFPIERGLRGYLSKGDSQRHSSDTPICATNLRRTCNAQNWLKCLKNLLRRNDVESWLKILSMFHVQAILLRRHKWVRNFNSLSTLLRIRRKVEDWSIILAQFIMLQRRRKLVVYPLEYIV